MFIARSERKQGVCFISEHEFRRDSTSFEQPNSFIERRSGGNVRNLSMTNIGSEMEPQLPLPLVCLISKRREKCVTPEEADDFLALEPSLPGQAPSCMRSFPRTE